MRKIAISILGCSLLVSTLTSCDLPQTLTNYINSTEFIKNQADAQKIEYTTEAEKQGLTLEQPTTGEVVGSEQIWIQGTFAQAQVEDQLLIQVSRGNQIWKKVVPVQNKKFRELVPLLYGKGKHEIQVMVPENHKSDYFLPAAIFTVDNTSSLQQTPIEYSRVYEDRGILLDEPIAGGKTYNGKILVRGSVLPTGKDADLTKYLVVQTIKGKDEAIYFLPVVNQQFSQWIPLRFGAGEYQVSLSAPEVPEENRDYFRFYTALELKVKNSATADLRDLLPSRGIESDHPQIITLARKITAHADTPLEKTRAIYQYVAKNTSYDTKKLRTNDFEWDDSALKTLRERKGVCQDYAFLTIALLRSLDIPARFVEGNAGNQRHAWVEAKVKGRWITMDPTWGSGYLTSSNRFVKQYDPSYFNPKLSTFKKTHKRTGISY